MVRVMEVDDEAQVHSGLRMILGSAAGIEVVATCEGTTAVDEVRRHRPEVVLLDIRMPEVDGLTVLRELSRWSEPPAVAMLTTFDADEFLAEALRAGAAGFLLKDVELEGIEPEQLIQAASQAVRPPPGDPCWTKAAPSAAMASGKTPGVTS